MARLANALVVVVLLTGAARAEQSYVDVSAGGSKHVRVGTPVAKVSVAGRDVADVAAFPPDELVITGKKIGETEINVWDKQGDVHTYVVRVTIPIEGLRNRLQTLYPGQKVDVQAVGTSVILTGQVKDVMAAAEIEKMAAAYLGGAAQVTSLLQVAGAQQVQLEVKFAEVSRSALRQMGVNLWTKNAGNDVAGGLLGTGTNLPGVIPQISQDAALQGQTLLPNGLPAITSPISGAFSLIFTSSASGQFPITATLSLLASHGFAKTLAEPTLVALSGQEASFLAGGEFPVPLPAALGTTVVEYKKFGIALKFTPFVLGDETIQLKMMTSVSDVDFSLGIRLAQVTVPGLTQRESTTTIRLRDGQSFAIAGLLADKIRSTVDKVPGLGDLPILGALFRSTSFRHDETELLVVVTAHIVNPMDKGTHIPMPGEDEVSDPNDLELFLLGIGEAHAPAPAGKVGFLR
jgi:pilus assembly protein CpaC